MEMQGGQTVPVFVQLEFEREQSWHKLAQKVLEKAIQKKCV